MSNPIQTVFGAVLLSTLVLGIPDGASPIPAPSQAKIQLACGNPAPTRDAQNLSTGWLAGISCGRYGQPQKIQKIVNRPEPEPSLRIMLGERAPIQATSICPPRQSASAVRSFFFQKIAS